jgi:Holliday junction resolvasome RuvABC endonuclease subunit
MYHFFRYKSGIMTIKISKKKEWEERIRSLHEQIQYWIVNVPEKNVEIVQLFY